MYFTPEVDEEVIREAVLQKKDKPLVNLSNKFCRDSTQSKTPISFLQIGEYRRQTRLG